VVPPPPRARPLNLGMLGRERRLLEEALGEARGLLALLDRADAQAAAAQSAAGRLAGA
jgi:hypothetical protein